MTKLDPPTLVVSVYLGWMPRYSPTSSVDTPAVNRPSTSLSCSPAFRSALRAASACSCMADLSGTTPMASDSSTPTMATLPDRFFGTYADTGWRRSA